MAAFDRWLECTRKVRSGQPVDLSLAARQVFNDLKVDQEFNWVTRALRQRCQVDISDDGTPAMVDLSTAFALLALSDPFAKPFELSRLLTTLQTEEDRISLESAALVGLSMIASRCGSMEDFLRHFESGVRRLVASQIAMLTAAEPTREVTSFVFEAIGLQRSAMMHRSFEDPMAALANIAVQRVPEDPLYSDIVDHAANLANSNEELPLRPLSLNRRSSHSDRGKPPRSSPQSDSVAPKGLLEAASVVLGLLARLPGSQAEKMVALEARHFRQPPRSAQPESHHLANDAFYILLRCAAKLDRADPAAVEEAILSAAVREQFYSASSQQDAIRRASLPLPKVRRPTTSETSSICTQPGGGSPKSAARLDIGSTSGSPAHRLLLIIDDDAYSDSELTPTKMTARTEAQSLPDPRLSPKSTTSRGGGGLALALPRAIELGPTESFGGARSLDGGKNARPSANAPARTSAYSHISLPDDDTHPRNDTRATNDDAKHATPPRDRPPEGCTGGCCVAM